MNKKIIIIVILIIIAIIITIACILNSQEKPQEIIDKYATLINEKKYEEMYEQITKEAQQKISKEDFITRNKNIYEGIDAVDIKNEIKEIKKENGEVKISYTQTMSTSAGKINLEKTTTLKKEDKSYKIEWASSQIFPQLRETDKVRISTIKATRGKITDRNGNILAEDGKISSVGIVPGKLGENKENNIAQISKLTGVSEEYINTQLQASYVKDDTFVPIKKVAMNETELKEQLLKIPGVMINAIDGRVYTYGKEAAHITGYVQSISQEILEQKEGQGYNSNSVIGKAGIEAACEEEIRGIDGVEIYIVDENGNKTCEIAKQDQKDGKDIKLTIDMNIQKQAYKELEKDKGFFVIMDPKTGEMLALVSTPTFDANDFVVGLTNNEWEELNNDTARPLYTRFLQSYCPGSTFKPITAGIGLTNNIINENTIYSYNNLSWQKDSSWGDYHVTTLTAYSGNKNVTNALIHSDNIFFAQAALNIGTDKYVEGLKKLGFQKEIDFPLSARKSQFSNGETIEREIKLADTGYGQGDLLVNPIHMASIYSAFANEGKMVKPYLLYEKEKVEYVNENAFSKEAADTIKNALIQVVENPSGTASDMKINGLEIAGKTGTAELKQSNDDKESGTLGWFDCFTTNRTGGDLLIIGMVENVQNNSSGGSHYVIQKIRNIL